MIYAYSAMLSHIDTAMFVNTLDFLRENKAEGCMLLMCSLYRIHIYGL